MTARARPIVIVIIIFISSIVHYAKRQHIKYGT